MRTPLSTPMGSQVVGRLHSRPGVRRRSGVALIVVLWTVVLLASVTAVAASAARGSAQVTTNRRAQATARAMAESGIVAATAFVNDSLASFGGDSTKSDAFLAALEPVSADAPPLMQDTLADGVFAVTIVDVNARLDINMAGADGLTMVLRTATGDAEARQLALLIESRVQGDVLPTNGAMNRDAEEKAARDSLGQVLLGRAPQTHLRHPFLALDELLEIPGFDEKLLARVAPLLTVDGDGRVNRRAASSVVLAAASGSLEDRPTRLLFIARGWQRGHALTREIQAVYDVAPDGTRLVRWREVSR